MTIFNLSEAQANLAQLVALIESGAEAEIIIAQGGKPIARLVPAARSLKVDRRLGLLEGQFPSTTQEEFDADNRQIARAFMPADDRLLFAVEEADEPNPKK